MKLIKKMALVIGGGLLMVTFMALSGIPREDVLECGLPDGSKFVLTAQYDWYPAARLFRSAAERMNQEPWTIKYQGNQGMFSASKSDLSYDIRWNGNGDRVSRELCVHMGKIHGIPVVAGNYLRANGDWFSKPGLLRGKFYIPDIHAERPEPIKSALEKAGLLGNGLVLIVPSKHSIVREQALYAQNSGYEYTQTIEGVYQSISTDGGKTWSDPVITTKAKIFEMGKPWIEQCFVARPIKLNGKKIEPDFPAPCAPREE